jgi:hypothetical protein
LQALVGRQAGGDDAQQVVGVTEEPLGLEHVRDGRDSFFEAHEGVAIFLAHGDEDERLERQAEGARVHDGTVTADRTAALQLPRPTGKHPTDSLHRRRCGKQPGRYQQL